LRCGGGSGWCGSYDRLSYVPTPKHRPLTMSVRADSLAQFGEVGKDDSRELDAQVLDWSKNAEEKEEEEERDPHVEMRRRERLVREELPARQV
jgi:hypothetical protein